MPEQHTPALHSKNVQTKGSSYFFDVKEAKNGNQYLTITQTSAGKDGQRYRSTVSVFGSNLNEFAAVLGEMAEKVKI